MLTCDGGAGVDQSTSEEKAGDASPGYTPSVFASTNSAIALNAAGRIPNALLGRISYEDLM